MNFANPYIFYNNIFNFYLYSSIFGWLRWVFALGFSFVVTDLGSCRDKFVALYISSIRDFYSISLSPNTDMYAYFFTVFDLFTNELDVGVWYVLSAMNFRFLDVWLGELAIFYNPLAWNVSFIFLVEGVLWICYSTPKDLCNVIFVVYCFENCSCRSLKILEGDIKDIFWPIYIF